MQHKHDIVKCKVEVINCSCAVNWQLNFFNLNFHLNLIFCKIVKFNLICFSVCSFLLRVSVV